MNFLHFNEHVKTFAKLIAIIKHLYETKRHYYKKCSQHPLARSKFRIFIQRFSNKQKLHFNAFNANCVVLNLSHFL